MEAPPADASEAPRFSRQHSQPDELELDVPAVRTSQQVTVVAPTALHENTVDAFIGSSICRMRVQVELRSRP